MSQHDDVIKWKHFPRYWPFVRGIHRRSLHKGQWRGALMFSLICTRKNGWVNNREAGDLRRYSAHYDVIVMKPVANDFTRKQAQSTYKFKQTLAANSNTSMKRTRVNLLENSNGSDFHSFISCPGVVTFSNGFFCNLILAAIWRVYH